MTVNEIDLALPSWGSCFSPFSSNQIRNLRVIFGCSMSPSALFDCSPTLGIPTEILLRYASLLHPHRGWQIFLQDHWPGLPVSSMFSLITFPLYCTLTPCWWYSWGFIGAFPCLVIFNLRNLRSISFIMGLQAPPQPHLRPLWEEHCHSPLTKLLSLHTPTQSPRVTCHLLGGICSSCTNP